MSVRVLDQDQQIVCLSGLPRLGARRPAKSWFDVLQQIAISLTGVATRCPSLLISVMIFL